MYKMPNQTLTVNLLRYSNMRIKGNITTWNDEKAFGFITPDGGGKQVFIHISDFKNRTRRPELNQEVVYTLSHDKQKRVCAKHATLPAVPA